MTGLELAAVQRDDALLDRVGSGQPAGAADDLLTSLLVEWCADVRSQAVPAGLQEVEATRIIVTVRRRSVRPVVVGVILMGIVGAGGVAAAATQAGPQSVLWPVAEIVAPAHAHSVEARDAVRSSLRRAHRQAVAGDRTGALATLRAALRRLADVRAQDGAHRLRAQVLQMETTVAGSADRSPAVPPSSPPVVAAPTPSITPSASPTPEPAATASAAASPAPPAAPPASPRPSAPALSGGASPSPGGSRPPAQH